MGVLTIYLPVTVDKLRLMTECTVTISEESNRVSLAGPQSSLPAPLLVTA